MFTHDSERVNEIGMTKRVRFSLVVYLVCILWAIDKASNICIAIVMYYYYHRTNTHIHTDI